MGARQSVAEERQRSNSLDAGGTVTTRDASRSVMSHTTASEFLQQLRTSTFRPVISSSDSNGSEEETPGPSNSRRTNSNRSHGTGHRQRQPARIRHLSRRSMPLFVLGSEDLNCPFCHKVVPSDEADIHFVMCYTRPRVVYNEDVLSEAKGECSICLDEMSIGDKIARLPCLCIYHKQCIDDWFKRKNSCPEHPGDD